MTTVINTPTLEDYIKVIEWAIDQNRIWAEDGSIFIHENYWETYRSETCVIITNKEITYYSKKYVINHIDTNILNMVQFTREYIIKSFRKKYDLR